MSEDPFDRLASEFAGWCDLPRDLGRITRWADTTFDERALRAFVYQFEQNGLYRSFCEGRACTPGSVGSWRDIPPVPTMAFKHIDLRSGQGAAPEAVFETSGTTLGGEARGRHFVRSLALYRAASMSHFRTRLLEGFGSVRFISLIPSPAALPASSLSFMVGAAAETFASEVSWVVDADGTIDRDGLARAAREAREMNVPALLLGTSFAFVHALGDSPRGSTELPAGSRVMETGGFKGRSRTLDRTELHARITEVTGVPAGGIVGEYGMTELLTQLYEPVVSEGDAGRGLYVPPPWLRVTARDPVTLEPLAVGEEGILSFFDLANLGSVCSVLTEDLGSVDAQGRVRLLGRAPEAEPRGCSRAMDELMSARWATSAKTNGVGP